MAKQFKASNFKLLIGQILLRNTGHCDMQVCAFVHHDGYLMWDSNITDQQVNWVQKEIWKLESYGDELKSRHIKNYSFISSWKNCKANGNRQTFIKNPVIKMLIY